MCIRDRDYLRGDGRAYRVGNGWGSFEVFQTQTEGDTFYQVKAWDDLSVVNWEQFVVTPEYIGRDVDTSPGGGRFYRQFAAPWVKRRMRVGESFSQAKRAVSYTHLNLSATPMMWSVLSWSTRRRRSRAASPRRSIA